MDEMKESLESSRSILTFKAMSKRFIQILIQKSVWSSETNIQTIKEIFEKVGLDFSKETGEANEKIIKETFKLF
jgi:hypothetical protein